MSGTLEGGRKARDANLAKDPNFYKKIGALGGATGGEEYGKNGAKPKGFAKNPELARKAGKKGGKISKRPPASYKGEYESDQIDN